jgi:hypothetical protein
MQEYEARIQSLTAAVHSANSHADDVSAAASAERAAAAAAQAALQQRLNQLQAAWQQERAQVRWRCHLKTTLNSDQPSNRK